jgi:prepilin signal peptidase PulO-like enzyme (type II secretory pathway)
MAIHLFAVAGLATGSLINWASNWLPRLAMSRASLPAPQPAIPIPAWWHFLTASVARQKPNLLAPTYGPGAAVELFTALIFAGVWARFGQSPNLLFYAAVCAFLILVAVIDLRYRLVLNVLIYPAIAATLLISLVVLQIDARVTLVGGAFGFSIFAAAALVRPGGLGGGDVKLASFIGLLFGFPTVLWALIVGVLSGGLVAVSLLSLRRWTPQRHMPYAPFLCLGALAALFFNPLTLIFRL